VPSSEHKFHRQHAVFVPDDKTGGDASGQTGTEHRYESFDQTNLVSQIQAIQKDAPSRAFFEYIELGTTGLLPALEHAEIVPVWPQNPNPFNVELEEELHDIIDPENWTTC
jgi:hypothetical protein